MDALILGFSQTVIGTEVARVRRTWLRALSPTLLTIVAVVALTILVAIAFAILLHWLQTKEDPIWWEAVAWFLAVVGILLRPVIAEAALDWPTARGTFVAAVLALITLPALMRRVNKQKRRRGLTQVAIPLGYGFALGSAQLITFTFVAEVIA